MIICLYWTEAIGRLKGRLLYFHNCVNGADKGEWWQWAFSMHYVAIL